MSVFTAEQTAFLVELAKKKAQPCSCNHCFACRYIEAMKARTK